MREVNLPDTSIVAGKLKTEESKQHDYDKICYALSKLGASHYEQICNFLNWNDGGKCSRRLKEMLPPTELNPKGKNLIYCTGAKGVTKRLRAAYLYDLVTNGQKSVEPEKSLPGVSIADYSRKLVQKNLFE
jgi:hypothetical protein